MTSEEFAKRFQNHPLGHAFQAMETASSIENLKNCNSMARGMLLLLEFQGELNPEEYKFLDEAAIGNAIKNRQRLEKTNAEGPATKQ